MEATTFVKQAQPLAVPIAWEANGRARVGGGRINLEFVVWSHKAGETPEQIQADLPTLELADIYAVIAWYLRNTEEAEAYLRDADDLWEKAVAEIDSRHPDRREHMARIRARYAAQQEQQAS